MKSRLAILFLFFIFLWGALVFRGTSLKLFPGDRLTNLQKRQFETSFVVKSRRGAILDRNGRDLAVSVATHSLFADPKLIESKKTLARTLAKKLGMNSSAIYKKIKSKKRRFVWIRRNLNEFQKKQVEALGERGLGFIEEPKRVYPNDRLLSQVIGFTGREGYGLEGLELAYDSSLSGSKKEVMVPRDARGRPLLNDARLLFDVGDGKDLFLTIDSDVQYQLEKELEDSIQEHEAERGVGIVMDVETSEILALANSPGYNLNQATMFSAAIRKNRAVTDAFEPGSTMKTFVVAAGLEMNRFKPSTIYDCEGGRLKIGKRWITEADADHKFEKLTVAEILAKSSNVGSAKMGFDIGAKDLRRFLSDLGFGHKISDLLPGLSGGSLQPLPWGKHLLSNVSFGHGISVNALQVAQAYVSIANGGVFKPPRLVRSFRDSVTGEISVRKYPEGRRVISEDVASTLTLMLTQATSDEGTGAAARVPGYPVAGKTGTAQKVDTVHGGYLKGKYISSFAGFVPAHQPRYVIYIAVDSPKENYYGSQVAAPLFSKIASYLMRKSGISPILISDNNVIEKKSDSVQQKALREIKQLIGQQKLKDKMPDLMGMSLREALKQMRGRAAKISIHGSGRVVRMSPERGMDLDTGDKVQLYLEQK